MVMNDLTFITKTNANVESQQRKDAVIKYGAMFSGVAIASGMVAYFLFKSEDAKKDE
jgi:formate/nitrite transporter FocA (FNT family)